MKMYFFNVSNVVSPENVVSTQKIYAYFIGIFL